MNKNKINTTFVALLAFALMLTIACSSFSDTAFAAQDIYGNRMTFPVAGWKQQGPSPWWSQGNPCNYNLSGAGYNAYSTVPMTSHILWQSQEGPGGVVGGFNPAQGYYANQTSDFQWTNMLVMSGRVYSTATLFMEQSFLIKCVDEETGEQLWITKLSGAAPGRIQLMQRPYKPSSAGGGNCLVFPSGGTNWTFVDGQTGETAYVYSFPRAVSFLCMGWNDTVGKTATQQSLSQNAIYGYGVATVNARESIGYCYRMTDGNAAIKNPAELIWEIKSGEQLAFNMMYDDVIMQHPAGQMKIFGVDRFTGEVLWTTPFNSWQNDGSAGYGKFIIQGDDQYMYAFDVRTGEQAWKSEIPLNSFSPQHAHCIGNNMLVTQGYDGTARAFDINSGKLLWEYYIGDCPYQPYQSWYGTWPCNQMPTGGIGAFATITGDHIQINPVPPGEKLRVFNADTGTIRWEYTAEGIYHNGHSPVIADGMLFAHDAYTASLLAFGKGPSAVTLATDSARIARGDYALITGTVTDQSAGQPGTPCVSSEDMTAWMEYLHAGMPVVQDKKGVTLTLYAQASDGSTPMTIGNVTTNGDTGTFAIQWIPPTEGIYTITGVFLGDDSYWTSNGSTILAVGAAQAPANNNTATTTAAITSITLAAAIIGVIYLKKPYRKTKEELTQ